MISIINKDDERIDFAYITSSRELALDEKVGSIVINPNNRENYGYREGNLESLARRIKDRRTEFAQRFNLTAIIVDDDDYQYNMAWQQAEIWPRDMLVPIRLEDGDLTTRVTLENITLRIPSYPWKNLRRLEGEAIEVFRERKSSAKAEYEMKILDYLRFINVDLIVSDSYMTFFGPTLLNTYGGRILNIHPAILKDDDPNKLPGPFPTRDAFTRAVYGYIIIDDKKVGIPEGRQIQVEYEGQPRTAVSVPRNNVTGVTVHVVTEDVDEGPVVLYRSYAFEANGITPEAIRNMNYAIKRELLPEAMLRYIEMPHVIRLIAEGSKENKMYPVVEGYYNYQMR